MPRPASTDYFAAFGNYIGQVPEEDILPAMESQLGEILALVRPVPESEGNVRHAPYTWSVKEVIGHITDAERIFAYRALRFARGDATQLPGFEENSYVKAAQFDRLRLRDLVDEFEHVRRANLHLFRGLPDEAWSKGGVASVGPITVRALAYVIVGHARHHANILRKRLQGAARA